MAFPGHFGIKYGMASTDQFSTENTIDEYNGPFPSDVWAKTSQSYGVLMSFPLGQFRFVPTLSYIEKGGEMWSSERDYGEGTTTWSLETDLSYLSVQSDFHLKFPFGSASFYVLASPRLDVLLTSESSGLVYTYSIGNTREEHNAPFNDIVWGAGIGLGQDIYIGKHVLFLEARYDRDLSSAWDMPYISGWTGPNSLDPVYDTQPVFNRMFLFQIGLRFGEVSRPDRKADIGVWSPAP